MGQRQNLIIGIIIIFSVLFFIFAMSLFISSLSPQKDYETSTGGSKIAIVEVKGVIYDAENAVRQLERYNKNKSVKGIVLRIESPGGGVAASQEIFEKVKQVRDSGKIVIASMGSVAASGGYYIACGADTIMANPGTTTGSIGVIAEIPNMEGLLSKVGIRFETIKSGKFKDTGSPYRKMTSEDRDYLQNFVNDAYDQFVDAVSKERNLDRKTVLRYADGRVFTGQQALAHALIDTIGTYEEAIAFAAKLAGIEGEPKTVKERKRKVTFLDFLFQDFEELYNAVQSWPRVKYQLVM